jgi:hypothetical protein
VPLFIRLGVSLNQRTDQPVGGRAGSPRRVALRGFDVAAVHLNDPLLSPDDIAALLGADAKITQVVSNLDGLIADGALEVLSKT